MASSSIPVMKLFEPGDIFLLSTDGLTDMVGDLEIADLMADGPIEATGTRFWPLR